jgi:hypothetical protein
MMTSLLRSLRFALVSSAVLCGDIGIAQDRRSAPQPTKETIKLVITPAQEPAPALRYRLTPRFADLQPGNAATIYAQAAFTYRPTADEEKRIGELLKASRVEFDRFAAEKSPTNNVERLFSVSALELLRIASRRERCEWDLPLREQNAFSVLLPEQHELRKLARLVALRARTFAAEGRYVEAIEMLTVGYKLAQHEGQTPLLIAGLVGISISKMMDDVALDLAGRAGAPNLYWALTARPRPLVDLRGAMEAESSMLDLSLPILRDAVEKEPNSRNWESGIEDVMAMLNLARDVGENRETGPLEAMKQFGRKAALAGFVAVKGAELRAYLIERGVAKERVERMGNTQLLLAHSKVRYDEHRDRMFRWTSIPYPQARAGLEEADRQLQKSKSADDSVLPWAELLLPAVQSVGWTHAKQERMGDVLRLVEALRLYAAEHDGKLPQSLADVQSRTPLPLDGITGEPFQYVVAGDTATLTLPPNRAGSPTVVYEITIAK